MTRFKLSTKFCGNFHIIWGASTASPPGKSFYMCFHAFLFLKDTFISNSTLYHLAVLKAKMLKNCLSSIFIDSYVYGVTAVQVCVSSPNIVKIIAKYRWHLYDQVQDKIEEDKAAEEQRLAILPPKKPEGPGELGKPHRVDKAKVDEETKRRIELGWQNNAYNEYVSDLISVHR